MSTTCSCSSGTRRCTTRRCGCKKKNNECSSDCGCGSACQNLAAPEPVKLTKGGKGKDKAKGDKKGTEKNPAIQKESTSRPTRGSRSRGEKGELEDANDSKEASPSKKRVSPSVATENGESRQVSKRPRRGTIKEVVKSTESAPSSKAKGRKRKVEEVENSEGKTDEKVVRKRGRKGVADSAREKKEELRSTVLKEKRNEKSSVPTRSSRRGTASLSSAAASSSSSPSPSSSSSTLLVSSTSTRNARSPSKSPRRLTANSLRNLCSEVRIWFGFHPRYQMDAEADTDNSNVFRISQATTFENLLHEATRHWHVDTDLYELRDELDRLWPLHANVSEELEIMKPLEKKAYFLIVPNTEKTPYTWRTEAGPKTVAKGSFLKHDTSEAAPTKRKGKNGKEGQDNNSKDRSGTEDLQEEEEKKKFEEDLGDGDDDDDDDDDKAKSEANPCRKRRLENAPETAVNKTGRVALKSSLKSRNSQSQVGNGLGAQESSKGKDSDSAKTRVVFESGTRMHSNRRPYEIASGYESEQSSVPLCSSPSPERSKDNGKEDSDSRAAGGTVYRIDNGAIEQFSEGRRVGGINGLGGNLMNGGGHGDSRERGRGRGRGRDQGEITPRRSRVACPSGYETDVSEVEQHRMQGRYDYVDPSATTSPPSTNILLSISPASPGDASGMPLRKEESDRASTMPMETEGEEEEMIVDAKKSAIEAILAREKICEGIYVIMDGGTEIPVLESSPLQSEKLRSWEQVAKVQSNIIITHTGGVHMLELLTPSQLSSLSASATHEEELDQELASTSFARFTEIVMPPHVFIDSDVITDYLFNDTDCFALSRSGALFTWRQEHGSSPKFPKHVVEPLSSFAQLLKGEKVVKVSCGDDRAMILTAEGKVYTIGTRCLGTGMSLHTIPQLITDLESCKIVDISCGTTHSLVLTETGNILTWGNNGEGRLGLGHLESQERPTLIYDFPRSNEHISAVIGGVFHSACISKKGALYTWGCGKFGQLGLLSQFDRHKPTLVHPLQSSFIVKVVCSNLFTAALTRNGDIISFGLAMAPTEKLQSYDRRSLAGVPRTLLQGQHIVHIATGKSGVIAVKGEVQGMDGDHPINL